MYVRVSSCSVIRSALHMVDRMQLTAEQPLREPVRIRLIRLVASPVANDHAVDHRHERIVEPLRLRNYFPNAT